MRSAARTGMSEAGHSPHTTNRTAGSRPLSNGQPRSGRRLCGSYRGWWPAVLDLGDAGRRRRASRRHYGGWWWWMEHRDRLCRWRSNRRLSTNPKTPPSSSYVTAPILESVQRRSITATLPLSATCVCVCVGTCWDFQASAAHLLFCLFFSLCNFKSEWRILFFKMMYLWRIFQNIRCTQGLLTLMFCVNKVTINNRLTEIRSRMNVIMNFSALAQLKVHCLFSFFPLSFLSFSSLVS